MSSIVLNTPGKHFIDVCEYMFLCVCFSKGVSSLETMLAHLFSQLFVISVQIILLLIFILLVFKVSVCVYVFVSEREGARERERCMFVSCVSISLILYIYVSIHTSVFKHSTQVSHPQWNARKRYIFFTTRYRGNRHDAFLCNSSGRIILFRKTPHHSLTLPGRIHLRLYIWSKMELPSCFATNSNCE